MTRQLFSSPSFGSQSNNASNGGVHKAPIHSSSARASRRSSSGSSYSISSASSSPLHDLESHLMRSHIPTASNSSIVSNSGNSMDGSSTPSIQSPADPVPVPEIGLSAKEDPLDPSVIAPGNDNAHDTKTSMCISNEFSNAEQECKATVEPAVRIYPCNRRSSLLSACMMKERLSWRAMGLDEDGCPRYALHIDECQGFKWNRNLQRIGHSSLGSFGSAAHGIWFELSDDEDYGSDDSDDNQPYEPLSL